MASPLFSLIHRRLMDKQNRRYNAISPSILVKRKIPCVFVFASRVSVSAYAALSGCDKRCLGVGTSCIRRAATAATVAAICDDCQSSSEVEILLLFQTFLSWSDTTTIPAEKQQ